MDILKVEHLYKSFGKGVAKKQILADLNFSLEKGKMIALVGPSGAGKSTFLNMICGLEKPDKGHIFLDGEELTAAGIHKGDIRKNKIGMVFQDFHLVDSLNVRDNIILPMTLNGCFSDEMEKRLEELTKMAGIGHLLEQYPSQISGGETQRVAICRAMVNRPKLILADEPTGNLDGVATTNIMQYFRRIAGQQSILMVTHDAYAAAWCDSVCFFADGMITGSMEIKEPPEKAFVTIMHQMTGKGRVM